MRLTTKNLKLKSFYPLGGVFTLAFLLLSFKMLPAQAGPLTDSISQGLNQIERSLGLPSTFSSLPNTIATIFRVVITLSGAIFMVILLIGGVMYLVNAGAEEGTTKAKRVMINAIIGLIITLSAWAVGLFILGQAGLAGRAPSPGENSGDAESNQTFVVQFIVKNDVLRQPVKDAKIELDGHLKGQTSTNGLLPVTITQPRSTYPIKVSKDGCSEIHQGSYTLERGTPAHPSELTIILNCF